MKKHVVADISLIIVTIFWGTSFGITKLVLDSNMGPITLMMYRSLFTIILLLPLLIMKLKKINKLNIELGVKLGIIVFLGFLFQTVGADYTSASKSAFLTTLNVIFVPIILFFTIKQKLTLNTLFASFLALIGAFYMTNPLVAREVIQHERMGDFLTIICSVVWALQIIKTSEYAKKTDVWLLVYFEFLTMCVLSFIATFFLKDSLALTIQSGLAILYLSIVCTVIAFAVQAIATRYTTPEKASIIFTFEGFFGALFSFIIVREELSLNTIIGGLIILSALIISELKLLDKFKLFRRKRWVKEEDLRKI